jgi:protein gp37
MTFNPYWGCDHISPGCDNCYAKALAKRTGFDCFGPGKPARLFGQKHWAEPIKWDRMAEEHNTRYRVFCGSMCDIFQDRNDSYFEKERLWRTIEQTPNLIWMLLTKRPWDAVNSIPSRWENSWPRNVWVGVTAENQAAANERIPILLRIPAAVRFVSAEPLLGPIRFDALYLRPRLSAWYQDGGIKGNHPLVGVKRGIDWLIVGGESGPGARPMHPDWVRSLRDQCVAAGVKFHFKQWGEWAWWASEETVKEKQQTYRLTIKGNNGSDLANSSDGGDVWMYRCGKKAAGRLLDGREWLQFPEAQNAMLP